MFPWFPTRSIDSYESGRHAPQVKAPTLVLAAERDEVIPMEHGAAAVARFAGGIATLEGRRRAPATSISEEPAYWKALRRHWKSRSAPQRSLMHSIESIQQLLEPLFSGLMGVRLVEMAPEARHVGGA